MKEEKIRLLIREMMSLAPGYRKNFMQNSQDSEFKLSPHQVFCLAIILRDEEISMGELAEKLGVSNQQLTRIVDTLVDRNCVERFTDPKNRRVVKAKVNEEGKNIFMQFAEEKRKLTQKALEVLTEEELDSCLFHIRALSNILLKIRF